MTAFHGVGCFRVPFSWFRGVLRCFVFYFYFFIGGLEASKGGLYVGFRGVSQLVAGGDLPWGLEDFSGPRCVGS